MMNNELLLQSNQPVPFIGARTSIHNPTMNEIGLISEESFQAGIHFLNFSKDMLSSQDKSVLADKSDFDIFMSVMLSKEKAQYKIDVMKVLTLLFPDYETKFTKDGIKLTRMSENASLIPETFITNENYSEFKDIINTMFSIEESQSKEAYNPADGVAARIAEKLQKGRQRAAAKHGKDLNKVAIFARYISILAVGEHKDKNQLMQYTVYQLNDEFKRWQLENAFDINLRARLAGATNLDEAENWMEDIHEMAIKSDSSSNNKNKK